MSNGNVRKLLSAVDRIVAVGALLLLAALVMTSVWASNEPRLRDEVRTLRTNLAVEFIAGAVVVAGSYFLFRRIQQVRDSERRTDEADRIATTVVEKLHASSAGVSLYEQFGQVPCPDLIARSKEIDFVVHYLDSWIGNNEAALKAFVRNGGSVRLILPDVRDRPTLEQIARRFEDTDAEHLVTKIEKTFQRLKVAAAQGRTEPGYVRYTSLPISYTAVIFDDRELVLSPFEHLRKLQVRSPAVEIDLGMHPDLRVWIGKEWGHLLRHSVPPRNI